MRIFTATHDSESTTIAKSKDLYDQIIITAGAFREYEATAPVLNIDAGIIPFDMDSQFSSLDHNTVKYKVSDHRPIWAKFRIDLGDDE